MAIVRTTNKDNSTTKTGSSGTPPEERSSRTSAGRTSGNRVVPSRAAGKTSSRIERARSAANRTNVSTQGSSPVQFIRDTQAELKRVVWPTKEVVTSGTIVTIGMLIFFAVYIFALNQIATAILRGLGLD